MAAMESLNSRSLAVYHQCVSRYLHKWLNKRGGDEPLYPEYTEGFTSGLLIVKNQVTTSSRIFFAG